MPILQNKLVMKSIEALHDEALALTPDSASENGVAASSPPAIIHATKSPHESPANGPKTDGDDIMARIDQLLKKLDEEDDFNTCSAVAPPKRCETSKTQNFRSEISAKKLFRRRNTKRPESSVRPSVRMCVGT